MIFKTVPEVAIGSAAYKGSYEQITSVNHTVATWVRNNGYESNGAMFYIYHVSPTQTQDLQLFVASLGTELYRNDNSR